MDSVFSNPLLLQRIFHYTLLVDTDLFEDTAVELIKKSCENIRLTCRLFRSILDDQIGRMRLYDFDRVMMMVFKGYHHNYDVVSTYHYFEDFVEAYSPLRSVSEIQDMIPVDRCRHCNRLRMVQRDNGWCVDDVYLCCGKWHCYDRCISSESCNE